MRIGETGSIFVGEKTNAEGNENIGNGKKNNIQKNSIYAGKLNIQLNPIAQKRKEAQEKAMKLIGDAVANEKVIVDDLLERRDKINQLNEEMGKAQKELKKLEDRKTSLKEEYGITEDSQEQKDLKLLEKRRDIFSNRLKATLTDDEKERLAVIDKEGPTEYQRRSLEVDATGSPYREIIEEGEKTIIEENAIIRGVNQELLKFHEVLDATKEAEAIKEAAGEEIIGMLIDEAKEQIDEKTEEELEATKKKAKEEEEQKEQLEELEEKREVFEKLANSEKITKKEKRDHIDIPTEEILELNHIKINSQAEVENIIDEMKLVVEDIKGAVVDLML